MSSEKIREVYAPPKPKRRGFWSRVGHYVWGSSNSQKTDQLQAPSSGEEVGQARIYDAEMLASLAQPDQPENQPEQFEQEAAAALDEKITVQSNQVFPTDNLKSHDEVIAYLDSLIDLLNEPPQVPPPSPVRMESVSPITKTPDVEATLQQAEKMAEDLWKDELRRREDAELVAYFEQLAREMADTTTDYDDMPELVPDETDGTDDQDSDTHDSMPELISDDDEEEQNTSDLFDSKANYGWSDFDVDAYAAPEGAHEAALFAPERGREVIIKSPQSPFASQESVIRRRRRPATPYVRTHALEDGDTDEDNSRPKRQRFGSTDDLLSPVCSPDQSREELVQVLVDRSRPEDFRELFDRLSSTSGESTTDETPLQVVCNECLDIAEGISRFFRRCQ